MALDNCIVQGIGAGQLKGLTGELTNELKGRFTGIFGEAKSVLIPVAVGAMLLGLCMLTGKRFLRFTVTIFTATLVLAGVFSYCIMSDDLENMSVAAALGACIATIYIGIQQFSTLIYVLIAIAGLGFAKFIVTFFGKLFPTIPDWLQQIVYVVIGGLVVLASRFIADLMLLLATSAIGAALCMFSVMGLVTAANCCDGMSPIIPMTVFPLTFILGIVLQTAVLRNWNVPMESESGYKAEEEAKNGAVAEKAGDEESGNAASSVAPSTPIIVCYVH